MSNLGRLQRMHSLFRSRRRPVPMQALCDELECSRATVKRDLAFLRDVMGAPIVNARGHGYFYDPCQTFELPGLWFSHEELHALLAMLSLVERLEAGMFRTEVQPLKARLRNMLDSLGQTGEIDRVRVLPMLSRARRLPHFSRIAEAVLNRRRLFFAYESRNDAKYTEREVSPQRLTHYRDNWYLDAWCHLRNDLRTFALERMSKVRLLDTRAEDVAEDLLRRRLESSYGIFSGEAAHVAVLHFSPPASRWVADEIWHPEQQSAWLENGLYELRIPYLDPTELILDICRHGPDVEVIAPAALRRAVAERLRMAAAQYATGSDD